MSRGTAAPDRARGRATGPKGARAADSLTLANHPTAPVQIRQAKGWGGLIGLGLAVAVSWNAGASPFEVGSRALVGGLVGLLLAWALAVYVWRHLALGHIKLMKDEAAERARRLAEERAGGAPDRSGPPPGGTEAR